jgi:hypothetical protein
MASNESDFLIDPGVFIVTMGESIGPEWPIRDPSQSRGYPMSEPEVDASSDHVASTSGILDVARQAAHDGAVDAREAAARTWTATSRFLSRFVYTTSYTVSYGVVFPAVLLAQSIPRDNAAVRGMIDGAHAAILKVDELRGTALERPEVPATRALAPA